MGLGQQTGSPGADFMRLMYSRQFAAAVEAGTELVSQSKLVSPVNLSIARISARLLTELGEVERARKFWLRLQEVDPLDLEASYHILAAALASDSSAETAFEQALPAASSRLRPVLADVIKDPLPTQVGEDRPRHIAICGVSFCGSTLLDRILGGLPNVRSIGESHWLVKTYKDKVARLIDFSYGRPSHVPQCSVCGPRCDVLTMEFRARLAADRTNWYAKVARRLGTGILISADKNPPKLLENDPLLRMDAIVLFKSPKQAWASQLDKLPKNEGEWFYREKLESYILQWVRTYDTFLNDFKPDGKVIFVSFDHFTDEPLTVLAEICSALDLVCDPAVLTRTVPWHAIGGNSRAMQALRQGKYSVEIRRLGEPILPSAHIEMLEGNARLQQTYSLLMARYGRLNGAAGSGPDRGSSPARLRPDLVRRQPLSAGARL